MRNIQEVKEHGKTPQTKQNKRRQGVYQRIQNTDSKGDTKS